MANYDDFKKRAKDALDSFADASVDAYKVAEEKARILARKTKLRAGIVNDKATIRRVSVELGTAYYRKYKDDAKSEFRQLCEEITGAHERIAIKEEEIAALKANAAIKADPTPATEPEQCCDDEKPCCEEEKPVAKPKGRPKSKPAE